MIHCVFLCCAKHKIIWVIVRFDSIHMPYNRFWRKAFVFLDSNKMMLSDKSFARAAEQIVFFCQCYFFISHQNRAAETPSFSYGEEAAHLLSIFALDTYMLYN